MKLFLYSFVGGFETDEILGQLKDPPKDEIIDFHINSPGGSVFDGFAIYNRLKTLPNIVNIYIDGLAGSVAAVMAMAGDTVYISEAGSIMVHNALSMMGGNVQDLEKQIDQLKAIDKVQIKIFTKKTGLSQAKVKELLEAESVLMANEAVSLGFADQITKPIKAVAQINLNDMNIKEKLKGLASVVFGEDPENDEVKELKAEIDKKTDIEVNAKIQEISEEDPKKAIFAEYVPNADFIAFKNKVSEFIGQVLRYIEDQPTGDEIVKNIKANTNEELYKLLTDVKSKNKVPTASEHKESILANAQGFDLEKAKKMYIDSKNN